MHLLKGKIKKKPMNKVSATARNTHLNRRPYFTTSDICSKASRFSFFHFSSNNSITKLGCTFRNSPTIYQSLHCYLTSVKQAVPLELISLNIFYFNTVTPHCTLVMLRWQYLKMFLLCFCSAFNLQISSGCKLRA